MILNKENLTGINRTGAVLPSLNVKDLPEKVLQFGTGVLLRGLPDYFIDKANKQGIFNGKVVVVKSTSKGDTRAFDEQDCLYTICVRGIEQGRIIKDNLIVSSLSRVLNAATEWAEILEVAASKELKVVISNTTETGIRLSDEPAGACPPVSFPGKLLAVLYHRYNCMGGSSDSGLVILPTELISDNGAALKEVILKMAVLQELEAGFSEWVNSCNYFCNTLVDRIVPGKPEEAAMKELEESLGYRDGLLIVAEEYRLWAIEGNDKVKEALSFAEADPGIIIASDISIYKELKLRLLNGTHTMACGAAFIAGFETVSQAMSDPHFNTYVTRLLLDEIALAIPYPIDEKEALDFALKVLDRFRNPAISHQWISICTNYTMKLQLRIVPVLKQYYLNFNRVPEHIAFGFAAYFHFISRRKDEGGSAYQPEDEYADHISRLWQTHDAREAINAILSDHKLWGTDLTKYSDLTSTVSEYYRKIAANGIMESINNLESNKISA